MNVRPNAPDISAVLIDARRCIATAKLDEFERQSWRLGKLVRTEIIGTGDAIEFLFDAALANDLLGTHGEEKIRDIVVRAVSAGFEQ